MQRASSPRGSDRTTRRMARVDADYIDMVDPLARVRGRKAVVKLYASGYGHEIARMRTEGFEDPDPPTFEPEEAPPPGIRLEDVKPAKGWMTEALENDLPEELLLPYEITRPGYLPRTFYLPARVLNEALGNADAKHP